ncbi:MAG: arginase family protein [Propionivibrio sp.]
MTIELTAFQGNAGEHNLLAIPGAKVITQKLGEWFQSTVTSIGTPSSELCTGWSTDLDRALPSLKAFQYHLERVYSSGKRSIAATGRCAVSLATLPLIARHFPDACVVWFDAHADLNTPDSTLSGYLGGLALSGPLGLWDTGLGAGLRVENVVLVGQRDIDPFEAEFIRERRIPLVNAGADIADTLARAIAGRPVYVHIDCDVLSPGIVPTDYVHDGGLSLHELRNACVAMAQNEVVGVEIAEFQHAWTTDGDPVSPTPLLEALLPIMERCRLAVAPG